MTALSELLPAGGAGKVMDFVASGTLPNGKAVVLKSDGTVEVVGESGTPVAESIPAGSAAVFNSGGSIYNFVAFDPNTANKFVVVCRDGGNSGYGTAIVGTVNGTVLSFGSEVVFNSGDTRYISVSFDPNTANKFVIAYQDGGNSNYGGAIVGTISGTTLSFGSEVVFNSSNTYHTFVAFDPNNAGKFVVAYKDVGNTGNGEAIVGTVSGTAITYGSAYAFNSGFTGDISAAFDPNNAGKFVVAYVDYGNSNYGTAIVGTVSGTTISFGSEVVFNSATTTYTSASFDPNTAGKFVVTYQDSGNSSYGTAIVGTVSGTTISFGSEAVFNSSPTYYISVSFDPNTANKFVVTYKDGGNSNYGTVIVGTVSGTSISYGSEFVFESARSDHISVAFDPNTAGKFVVVYLDDANSSYGTAIVGQIAATVQATNLTTSNFVGITSKAISDTATGPITLQGGISTNQSSLTVGSTYYVQANGTVSTVSTSPAVNIGKALNATTLKLKGLSV